MVRTIVGYAGGAKENPNYHSLGSHSETVQIDFDPTVISYEELLDVFWDSHYPVSRPISQQYMSIIFYHNEEQKALAEKSKEQEEARLGQSVQTLIVPFSKFYPAEDYHQKYYLQHDSVLYKEFRMIYPDINDFISSTSAARVNGYVGGYGTSATLEEDLDNLGLSAEGRRRIMEIAGRGLRPGCPVPLNENP